MSRPSASTFASPPGPVQPGPSGRSVPVSGWDRGTAIAEETDNDPEPHRPQQASRTAEAGTPARTGLGRRGGVLHLTSSSMVVSSETGKD